MAIQSATEFFSKINLLQRIRDAAHHAALCRSSDFSRLEAIRVDAERRVKRTEIGPVVICSLYIDLDHWDIWTEASRFSVNDWFAGLASHT